MTAKLRAGLDIPSATGADSEAAQSRLMAQHRQGARPEGASIHSFSPQEPDNRESDDAGIADVDQGMPPPEQPPKGKGIELPDLTPARLRQGEHATTDGITTEDD